MRVRAWFKVEEERELELDVGDDGYTYGDLVALAAEREPFTEFVEVLHVEELDRGR